jgi:pyruvate formate lyase activating enzyme
MTDVGPTPASTLTRAREIGLAHGLRYVYTGNVHDTAGGSTVCPHCANEVIVRDWYNILNYRVSAEGSCKECGGPVAGRFEAFKKPFGARRIPVRLASAA